MKHTQHGAAALLNPGIFEVEQVRYHHPSGGAEVMSSLVYAENGTDALDSVQLHDATLRKSSGIDMGWHVVGIRWICTGHDTLGLKVTDSRFKKQDDGQT